MDRKEIAAILASAGLRPQHQFGQNFMVDPHLLQAIVDAGAVGPQDVILEVGPGVGNLTRLFSQAVPQGAVLAVDIDRKLLPAAQRHHANLANVTWLLADVLAGKHAIEPRVLDALRDLRSRHPGGTLKLVSNLPYNAASPLIAELLVEMWRETREEGGIKRQGVGSLLAENAALPENSKFERDSARLKTQDSGLHFSRLTFTVQWEVALRMAAPPDCRDYGPLGILIQALADVQIVRKIPPGAFWPPPKIHSALVVVTPQPQRISALPDAPAFQLLLSGIFAHRRQTLANALKHHLTDAWTPALKAALSEQFDLTRRPENFTVDQLLQLAATVARHVPPQVQHAPGQAR